MIRLTPLACLVIALWLAGCTVRPRTEPTPDQSIPQRTVIETVPDDARCRAIGRDGRRDGLRAPFSIDPRQLGFPVEVTCEAPGYFATTETLYPRPLPSVLEWTANRQSLSAMADIRPAAGAPDTASVPFRMILVLRGSLFDTPAARDAFYDQIYADRLARWSALLVRAESDCDLPDTPRAGASSTSPPEICRRAYDWLRQLRDADMNRLEIDRRRSTFR